MSDFTKLKVGDTLYSMRFGPVTVKELTPFNLSDHPILCTFISKPGYAEWTSDGKFRPGDENPDLYWSKPVFTEPQPPEERVVMEKVYSGWWICAKKKLRGPFPTKEEASASTTSTIEPVFSEITMSVIVPSKDTPLPD